MNYELQYTNYLLRYDIGQKISIKSIYISIYYWHTQKLTIIMIRGTFIITVFTQLEIAKCHINTSHFIE